MVVPHGYKDYVTTRRVSSARGRGGVLDVAASRSRYVWLETDHPCIILTPRVNDIPHAGGATGLLYRAQERLLGRHVAGR